MVKDFCQPFKHSKLIIKDPFGKDQLKWPVLLWQQLYQRSEQTGSWLHAEFLKTHFWMEMLGFKSLTLRNFCNDFSWMWSCLECSVLFSCYLFQVVLFPIFIFIFLILGSVMPRVSSRSGSTVIHKLLSIKMHCLNCVLFGST